MRKTIWIAVALVGLGAGFLAQTSELWFPVVPHPLPDYSDLSIPHILVQDQVVGKGAPVVRGEDLLMSYQLYLYDPKAKANRGPLLEERTVEEPFKFRLGEGSLLKGWERGVYGMNRGGERVVVVPSHLAYGDESGPNGAPRGSILLIQMKILSVQ